ncbi:MAG: hypothetical protein Q9169_000144 [Polycauliona sp. 2 TL-2023]
MTTEFIGEFLDPRIESQSTYLGGIKYHYLLGQPGGTPRATIFLFHGWPDLSIGWRNQIPMLLDLGFRVVAPDMIGYGQTLQKDCGRCERASTATGSIEARSWWARLVSGRGARRRSKLKKETIRGGAIVYRIALWCPELVTHIFSICTPYTPPSKSYTSLEDMIKSGKVPNFGYQLQLASGQLEEAIRSKAQIQQLLNGLYGGLTSEGLPGFDVKTGVHLDRLHQLKPTKMMNERLLEHYTEQYARNGIHGTCKQTRAIFSKLQADGE